MEPTNPNSWQPWPALNFRGSAKALQGELPEAYDARLRSYLAEKRQGQPATLEFIDTRTLGVQNYMVFLDGELTGLCTVARAGHNGYVIQYLPDWSQGKAEQAPAPNGADLADIPKAGWKLVEKNGHVVIIHVDDLHNIVHATYAMGKLAGKPAFLERQERVEAHRKSEALNAALCMSEEPKP
jgi:hypothetical protein